MTKNKLKNIVLISVVTLSICATITTSLCLTSCHSGETWTDESLPTSGDVYVDPTSSSTSEDQGEYHSDIQYAYINSSWNQISKFADGTKELSIPKGNVIDLSSDTEYDYFQLSTENDFSTYTLYATENHSKTMVYNLLSGTTYYYRGSNSKKDFDGKTVHSFTIANSLPRNLFIDGVTNVRDLGGYTSKLGGKIRQNMFIRGGKLTGGSTAPSAYITSAGLKMLTKNIGVKSEIDLRMSEESDDNPENGHMTNAFFDSIEYYSVPINYGNTNMLTDCKDQIKKAFEIYSVADNYPVYVHCSIGTDRTGVISYLMGALLGISDEELYKDYLFSNLGNIGSSRDESVIKYVYYPTLTGYKKATLAECAEAYLLDIGLTQAQVDNIRSIMIAK